MGHFVVEFLEHSSISQHWEFHEKTGTGITWRFLRLLSPSLSPLLSYLLGSYSVASFRLVLVSP